MEKSCHSSAPSATSTSTTSTTTTSTTTTTTINATTTPNPNPNPNPKPNTGGNTTTSTIRMLNRNSHKITKPIITKHQHQQSQPPISSNNSIPPTNNQSETIATPASNQPAPALQPQPPVYNINKNDFRDVVQKLTGSPAHLHTVRMPSQQPVVSTPPTKPTAIAAITSSTSRLHKIRPPPLAHVGPRPDPGGAGGSSGGNLWIRPSMNTPSSPLPPFPTVSAAAESPITAYMRCLRGGNGGGAQQQQSGMMTPSSPGPLGAPLFPLPTSPLAFGCLPSPRSGYPMLLPPSPRLPMPSPKWKDQ